MTRGQLYMTINNIINFYIVIDNDLENINNSIIKTVETKTGAKIRS